MTDWLKGVRIHDDNGIFVIQHNTHDKNDVTETLNINKMLGYKIILHD